jgi:hypothetical protein
VSRRAVAFRRRWALHAIRAGGALVVLGSVLPWAYLPMAGVRLPIPGIVGWGALTLVLGAWLLRRPAWWSALPAGLVATVVAWKAFHVMPAAVMSGVLLLEQRMQPLNGLLARFALPPVSLFDLRQPWSRIRGPGEMTALLGGLIALVGGLATLASYRDARALEHCVACGHRDRPGRVTAFCVACGAPMPAERACPECHTLAEPGDACCGVCGARLAAAHG